MALERKETVADLLLRGDSVALGEDVERKMKILAMENDPSRGPPIRRQKLLDHYQLVALMKSNDLDSYSVSLSDELTESEESVSQGGEAAPPHQRGQQAKDGLVRQRARRMDTADLEGADEDDLEERGIIEGKQTDDAIEGHEDEAHPGKLIKHRSTLKVIDE